MRLPKELTTVTTESKWKSLPASGARGEGTDVWIFVQGPLEEGENTKSALWIRYEKKDQEMISSILSSLNFSER